MNNLHIAKTHSQNRKLIAYCVSKASLLALITNSLVVPAGLVSILFFIHLALPTILFASLLLVPLGIMLAITVDGMTLGACARLRKSLEYRIEIKNRYARIPEKELEIALGEAYELQALYPSYTLNSIFIVLFTLISAGAGWILWHTLLSLAPGFPEWMSLAFSTLFAISVSVTLIASELLKVQNEVIVKESIEATHFHKAAYRADAEEEALKVLHAEYTRQAETMKNSPLLATVVEENVQSIYNDILFDGENIIQKRIEADNVARERAERKRLDRVREQQALLSGNSVSSEERNTGPIQQIASPKFKRLGNSEKVALAVEKYGEPYIRQNIDLVCSEIGMSKPTVYSHMRKLKEG